MVLYSIIDNKRQLKRMDIKIAGNDLSAIIIRGIA